jgi:hypothetical protein
VLNVAAVQATPVAWVLVSVLVLYSWQGLSSGPAEQPTAMHRVVPLLCSAFGWRHIAQSVDT